MTTRYVQSPADCEALTRLLAAMPPPFTVSIVKGKRRSLEQNNTQFLWLTEAVAQLQDETIEEKRAWAKLHLGVPIMRNESESFRAQYDAIIRPLPYEAKLALMKPPIDLPVTSLMTTKQEAQYLDQLRQHFEAQGVRLTMPNVPEFA